MLFNDILNVVSGYAAIEGAVGINDNDRTESTKTEASGKNYLNVLLDAVVLDFFVGSGTTSAVAHKMKRHFIGVEQLDYIESLTKTRLLNVINGDSTGISKNVKWSGGGSFIYCELKELNQQFIKKITDSNVTSNELNSLYTNIINSNFISTKVDSKDLFSDEVTGDFTQLDNSQKKEVLLKLLDLNMLYVNYSDLDDADYNISEEDKKFSRSFYGDKE